LKYLADLCIQSIGAVPPRTISIDYMKNIQAATAPFQEAFLTAASQMIQQMKAKT